MAASVGCHKIGYVSENEWEYVRSTGNEISKMITDAKENSFASLGRKLSDPSVAVKTHWSTLNKIVNNKNTTNIYSFLRMRAFAIKIFFPKLLSN